MKDKVAIVTGGTGALGRVIVNKLSGEGLKVYVPSRSLEEFNKVFDGSQDNESDFFKLKKIFCLLCNATVEESVSDFVSNVASQEKGNLGILINTVGGIIPASDIIDLTTEDLDKMINLNFKSAFYFTREALKVMKTNGYGRIISIGASAGLETSPGRFAYSLSKAGVINLMDTVSDEMKDHNIRSNTIIPGIIDTPANREWGSKEDISKWVKAEEISDIIYNLISEEFSAIRNSHIKVYGSN